jgi:hypothetical protein
MHRKPALTFTGGPAVLLAALWGWVDQKNEAVRLLSGLVGGLSDRLAGVRKLERREAIPAAHTTVVAAAFFDVLDSAGKKLDPELHAQWNEVRTRLLGEDVPEKLPSDNLLDLLTTFD